MIFRRATYTDLPSIVRLLADDALGSSREDISLPLSEAYTSAFRAIGADPNQFLAVACEAGEIVGTLQMSFIPGLARTGAWRGQIEAVRIAAHHRGGGLGRRMFEWAIEECRKRGCTLIQLTSDKDRQGAHRFYEQLGFIDTHIGYKLTLW